MSNKPKIQGTCPYCGAKKVKFTDQVWYIDGNYNHTNKNVPMCGACDNDEIEIRKINNRRYQVVGKFD